jgi:hypothetical protein
VIQPKALPEEFGNASQTRMKHVPLGQVLKEFLNLNLFEHCPKKMQMPADARY